MAGKPFIGVNLSYRLQLYGFMYGSDFVEAGLGNLGYKDQHLALRWLQENIAAFGGDPTKVTIWGESGGRESVGAHLISYGGRDQGLFRASIMESANPINPFRYKSPAEWDVYYDAITAAANCSNAADTVACLRTVPSDTLTAIFESDVVNEIPSWGMEIDGEFIENNAREALLAGDFIKVPILHGQNHDEGTALVTRGIDTDAQFPGRRPSPPAAPTMPRRCVSPPCTRTTQWRASRPRSACSTSAQLRSAATWCGTRRGASRPRSGRATECPAGPTCSTCSPRASLMLSASRIYSRSHTSSPTSAPWHPRSISGWLTSCRATGLALLPIWTPKVETVCLYFHVPVHIRLLPVLLPGRLSHCP